MAPVRKADGFAPYIPFVDKQMTTPGIHLMDLIRRLDDDYTISKSVVKIIGGVLTSQNWKMF